MQPMNYLWNKINTKVISEVNFFITDYEDREVDLSDIHCRYIFDRCDEISLSYIHISYKSNDDREIQILVNVISEVREFSMFLKM